MVVIAYLEPRSALFSEFGAQLSFLIASAELCLVRVVSQNFQLLLCGISLLCVFSLLASESFHSAGMTVANISVPHLRCK